VRSPRLWHFGAASGTPRPVSTQVASAAWDRTKAVRAVRTGGATLATSPARLRGGGHREARFPCSLRTACGSSGLDGPVAAQAAASATVGEQGVRPCDGIRRWADSSEAVGRSEYGGNARARTVSGFGQMVMMLSSCSARDALSVRRQGRQPGSHQGVGSALRRSFGLEYRDGLRPPRRFGFGRLRPVESGFFSPLSTGPRVVGTQREGRAGARGRGSPSRDDVLRYGVTVAGHTAAGRTQAVRRAVGSDRSRS